METIFTATKAVVGDHWYARVGGELYRGPLDAERRPLLAGCAPVRKLDMMQSLEECDEIDAAESLLIGPAEVRECVHRIDQELQAGYSDVLDASAVHALAQPALRADAVQVIRCLTEEDTPDPESVHALHMAITRRDYQPYSAEQMAFLEQQLLAEINEAADHICNATPYYAGGPVPGKHTTLWCELRACHGDHDCPSVKRESWDKLCELFPEQYVRGPLPSCYRREAIEERVGEAMDECSATGIDVTELVSALIDCVNVLDTVRARVQDPDVADNIGAHLLAGCEGEDDDPWYVHVSHDFDTALQDWLATAELHEHGSWAPLASLHPSDWRSEYPGLELGVQPPFGWLDHTNAADGYATFVRGWRRMLIRFPARDDDAVQPGARFLITEAGRRGQAVLFEADDWLEVIAWLELQAEPVAQRKTN
jgi:hypothetical protein